MTLDPKYVHILPLYKEELDKMLAADIIVPVTEPTEWVNLSGTATSFATVNVYCLGSGFL